MANPGYEEKSSVEEEGNVTGLVDSSSYDERESPATSIKKRRLSDSELNTSLSHNASEDESPAAPMKKQCLSDLNTSSSHDGFSDFDAKKEVKSEASSQSKPVCDCTYYGPDLDAEDMGTFNTDTDLLVYGRHSWRRADRWNQREEYFVNLTNPPREESKCLELLDKIDCGDRFLGCSVEMRLGFFAQLNTEEAAKMQDLEEIYDVCTFRSCVWDMR